MQGISILHQHMKKPKSNTVATTSNQRAIYAGVNVANVLAMSPVVVTIVVVSNSVVNDAGAP